MFQFLTTDAGAAQPMSPMGTLLYWVVLIGAFGLMFYFMTIRPQKKQQKNKKCHPERSRRISVSVSYFPFRRPVRLRCAPLRVTRF